MSFITLTEVVSQAKFCVNPAYIVKAQKNENLTRILLHNGISIDVTEPFDGVMLLLKAEGLMGGTSLADMMSGEFLDTGGHVHHVTRYDEFSK